MLLTRGLTYSLSTAVRTSRAHSLSVHSIPTGYRRRFNTRYVEGLETDLREQLQTTLSDAYRLERELGGGGMSRVFLAEELALGRRVVVKVLSPDLAAGVNFERFKREILFTARLQHPHIVPVFTTA